jgi:uncharacterized phage protein gp47/JayE
MPFETPSLPVLIKRTQSDLAGDSLRQSDAQVLARTLGGAAYGLYGYLDWIAEQILPDKADESTLGAHRCAAPEPAAQSRASGHWQCQLYRHGRCGARRRYVAANQ